MDGEEEDQEGSRPGTNVKGCLTAQRGKGGKECNIGLSREEMAWGGFATQQRGFLIQFSLLLL